MGLPDICGVHGATKEEIVQFRQFLVEPLHLGIAGSFGHLAALAGAQAMIIGFPLAHPLTLQQAQETSAGKGIFKLVSVTKRIRSESAILEKTLIFQEE